METLKEFQNILLGQQLIVHTDHKNLTYKTHNCDRVMRWRLLLEEYGPTFEYIPGQKNIVADALSRLEFEETPAFKSEIQESHFYQDQMAVSQQDVDQEDIMPVEYNFLFNEQTKDRHLQSLFNSKESYHKKTFYGGGKTVTLICHKDRIVIPKNIQQKVISWYHEILVHPGADRTEKTIAQHFYWKGMQKDIRNFVVCVDNYLLPKENISKFLKGFHNRK